MSVEAPPVYQPLSENGQPAALPWILFFNSIYDGDSGTTWEPSFTGLTTTGTPTITGKYFRISGKLIYFNVVITPATNTSSVAEIGRAHV